MSILENITLQMELNSKDFDREFKDVTKVVNRQMDAMALGAQAFEAQWEDITSNLRSVKRVASGLAISAAIYAVTNAVTSASSAILTFRNNLEAAKISMTYFADSSAQAWEYIRELEDFAAYTPFSTEGAVNMAQYLQAMSVPISASKSMLTVISDTAAATGSTEENMQRIVTALGQILTKGKLAAEEVRQLANANIPIYDILKEQLNLTGQEIKNLGNLNINASKAVVAILDGLRDRYEGASAKIAETLGGMTETIKDDALIISEAFFHGALDGIENKIRGIRDTLDEWRDISIHEGTGGMIEAILKDLDDSGQLEQYTIAAIAGFMNLGDTIREFTTKNGNLLKIFAKTGYTSIMSLTVAVNTLLSMLNAAQDVGDRVVDMINKMTGMSLTLSDVVTGLLVFKTISKTLYFAGNTALWTGKQFITLGTSLTSIIPGIASASAFTKGLTASLLTVGAAAASTYLGLKAIQGITGVSADSSLVSDEYKQRQKELDDALSAYEDSLNEDYASIADGFESAMSNALDNTEKKSNKTAKKAAKTWLMSFDEVFQIREDPDNENPYEDLELFDDIDWGSLFSLPIFRFPERLGEELADNIYHLGDEIHSATNATNGLTMLLPGLISALTIAGTIAKNRKDYLDKKRAEGKPLSDDELTAKELKQKLDDDIASFNKADDLLGKMADEYTEQTKAMQQATDELDKIRKSVNEISSELHEVQLRNAVNSTPESEAEIDILTKQLEIQKKLFDNYKQSIPDAELRTQLADKIAILQKRANVIRESMNKRMAATGDISKIEAPGSNKAEGVLNANKINEKIQEVTDRLTQYDKTSAEYDRLILQLAEADIRSMDAIQKSIDKVKSELASIAVSADKSIRSISKDITAQLSIGRTTSNIDTSAFDAALKSRLRYVNTNLSQLVRSISKGKVERLVNTLKDLPITLKNLTATAELIKSSADARGLSLDVTVLQEISDKLNALNYASSTLEKVRSQMTRRDQLSDAYKNKGDISIKKTLDKVEDDLRTEYIPNFNIAQEVVRLQNKSANTSTDMLKELDTISKTIDKLPLRISEQMVSNVYSIAREINALTSGGSTFSTSRITWYKQVSDILDDLQVRVGKLPYTDTTKTLGSISTKSLSEDLLYTAKRMLNLESDDNLINEFTAFSDKIDKYADSIKTQLSDTIQSLTANAELIAGKLSFETAVSAEQLEAAKNLYKRIELTGKEILGKDTGRVAQVPTFKMSDEIYKQQRKNADAIDEALNKFAELENKSSGKVRTLYKDLQHTLQNNKVTVDSWTRAIERNKTAFTIGNTIFDVRDVLTSNNEGVFKAILENTDKIAQNITKSKLEAAVKAKTSTTNKKAPIPLSKLTAEAEDEMINLVKQFNVELKTLNLTADELNTYIRSGIIQELELIKNNPNAEVASILREKFLIPGNTLPEALYDIKSKSDIKWLVQRLDTAQKVLDEIDDSIHEVSEQYTNKLKAAFKETFNDGTPKFSGILDNELQALKELERTWTKALGSNYTDRFIDFKPKEELSKFAQLEAIYSRQRSYPGGFNKATGLYSEIDFDESRSLTNLNIFSKYLKRGANSARDLSTAIAPAIQAIKLGTLNGGITQRGAFAQGALSNILGLSATDEIVETAASKFAAGAAEAFNTRTKELLLRQFGTLYSGDTVANMAGTYGAIFDGLTKIEDKIYGVVQRTLIHPQEQLVDKFIKLSTEKVQDFAKYISPTDASAHYTSIISFSDFKSALGGVADDLVNKVAATLVSTPKISGTAVALYDASKFPKLLERAKIIPQSIKDDLKQIKEHARQVTADAILSADMPSGTLAAALKTLIVTRDDGLKEFASAYEKNTLLIRDALETARLAKMFDVRLDLTPSTIYGLIADTTARYEKATEAANSIPSIADTFTPEIEQESKLAGVSEELIDTIKESLDNIDAYIRARVLDSLKTNNIAAGITALEQIRDAVSGEQGYRQLSSGNKLHVNGTQYAFNLLESGPNGAVTFKAIAAAVDKATYILNQSTPRLITQLNDMYSAVLRGKYAGDDLDYILESLARTAAKLEDRLGMVNKSFSKRLFEAAEGKGELPVADINPFRLLSMEEAVGKMLSDLTKSTGLSLYKLFDTNDTDVARLQALMDTYTSKKASLQEMYPAYSNHTPTPDIPYIFKQPEIDLAASQDSSKLLKDIDKYLDDWDTSKLLNDIDVSTPQNANKLLSSIDKYWEDWDAAFYDWIDESIDALEVDRIFDAAGKPLYTKISTLGDRFKALKEKLLSGVDNITEGIKSIPSKIKNTAQNFSDTIKSAAQNFSDTIKSAKSILDSVDNFDFSNILDIKLEKNATYDALKAVSEFITDYHNVSNSDINDAIDKAVKQASKQVFDFNIDLNELKSLSELTDNSDPIVNLIDGIKYSEELEKYRKELKKFYKKTEKANKKANKKASKQVFDTNAEYFKNVEIDDAIDKTLDKTLSDSDIDALIRYLNSGLNDSIPLEEYIKNIKSDKFINKTATGISGKSWYDALFDENTIAKLNAQLSDEQSHAMADFMSKIYSTYTGMDTDNLEAFFRVDPEAVGKGSVDAIDDAIEKAAKQAFGDNFDEISGIIKGLNEPVNDAISKSFGQKLAEALNTPIAKFGLQMDVFGAGAFDFADSIRHYFDARSQGLDEYQALTSKWTKEFGYNVAPIGDATNNLISASDAFTVALQNLVVEGMLSGIAINTVGSALATQLGLTGLGAAGVSMGASIPIALLGSLAMYATGAYSTANMASSQIAEMLNSNTWAYDQAKAQGATDAQASEIQLKAQRDLYLKYYNEMSGFWHPFNKQKIEKLEVGNKDNTDSQWTIALGYAINNLSGNSNRNARYTEKDGLIYLAGNGPSSGNMVPATEDNGRAMSVATAVDEDKLYAQLYSLITSGGLKHIEDYNNKNWWQKLGTIFNGEKLTNLERTYRDLIENMDSGTFARIQDMFKTEFAAREYLDSRGEDEVKSLLQAYGLATGSDTQLVDGIIALYEYALRQWQTKMAAKGEFITSGDHNAITAETLLYDKGTANRLLDLGLSSIKQEYLNSIGDATGLYFQAVSETMSSLTYNIEEVRDKMTGFTVTFPSSIQVGTDTIDIKEILASTKDMQVLQGIGVTINTDGTVTISTEAINYNESGHDRIVDYNYANISDYEKQVLKDIGLLLSQGNEGEVKLSLDEATMQNAVSGLTYNLAGIDLTTISTAAIEALKQRGISLAQNAETGAVSATITDAGYITGSKDIASLIANLDADTLKKMSTNLTESLSSIDALNAYLKDKGESRIAAAAGVVLKTDFAAVKDDYGNILNDYAAALEASLGTVGTSLKLATDNDGNAAVYAAVNNVGESWHKAITQWETSDITPAVRSFLESLGADVETYGQYTMVDTETILKNLGKASDIQLKEIIFDIKDTWDQMPDELKKGFVDAGYATEDGFILLQGEALDGWTRVSNQNGTSLAKSFSAMNNSIIQNFIKMQGTTIKSWDELTYAQKEELSRQGITTEEEYLKNANKLLETSKNELGIFNNNTLTSWDNLTQRQKELLAQQGIVTETQYNANADKLKLACSTELGLLKDTTILGWNSLSEATKTKLQEYGVTNAAEYQNFLTDLNTKEGASLSELNTNTARDLLTLGATTASGFGVISVVPKEKLSTTLAEAAGYLDFDSLDPDIRAALETVYGTINSGWVKINDDATTQMDDLSTTVDRLKTVAETAKEYAAQIRQALSDPAFKAQSYDAELRSFSSTALEAAKSSSDKWAVGSVARSFHYDSDAGKWMSDGGLFGEKKWSNWSDKITLGSMTVAINENKLVNGKPAVYYIYDLTVNGKDGQIIRNQDGVWQKYLGGRPHNDTDNLPYFKMGGIVTGDGLYRAGEFGMHEAIVPMEQPQAMRAIGSALAAAIPTWELLAPLATMLGKQDGGVVPTSRFHREETIQPIEDIVDRVLSAQAHRAPQTSMSSSEDSRRPLYVGTLIADRSGLRELNRQMKIVERQDGGR